MRDITEAGATVVLGNRQAHRTEIAELLPQIGRKLVGTVDLGSPRRDLGLRELTHRVAQRLDVFAEWESESGFEQVASAALV